MQGGGVLRERLKEGIACSEAREVRERECFRGGDVAHRQELAAVRKVADDCSKKLEYKLERDICYECQDYAARLKAAGDLWQEPDACTEKKDSVKVNCVSIHERIGNAVKVRAALDALAKCFNGQFSEPRKARYAKASENEAVCRDVVDFKEGKKLCL